MLFNATIYDAFSPDATIDSIACGALEDIAIWTVTWLSITHTMYAAFDINTGYLTKMVGLAFYFYHRYAEFSLHCFLGLSLMRPDHLLQAAWHAWK